MMASGSSDASVLIWDVMDQRGRQQPPAPLSPAQLDKLWTDLAANDAALAYQAMCILRASPRQAVPLLEKHLKPVPRPDAKRIAEALRNLDSDRFTVRNQAAKELEDLGEAVEPALRQALADKPSPEVQRRLGLLLDQLEGANRLRRSRAVEVLEQTGTAEARRLLQTLAEGASEAWLTQEAKAALERLERRPQTRLYGKPAE
jgi:hypothetical protein